MYNQNLRETTSPVGSSSTNDHIGTFTCCSDFGLEGLRSTLLQSHSTDNNTKQKTETHKRSHPTSSRVAKTFKYGCAYLPRGQYTPTTISSNFK